jgi:hypothetical protein
MRKPIVLGAECAIRFTLNNTHATRVKPAQVIPIDREQQRSQL